jgi:hypothetical protein
VRDNRFTIPISFQPKINFMKKGIYFMTTIAIVILLAAQGVRVSAAESETDPDQWCRVEEDMLLGVCVLDTESRPVCILQFQNQNCTASR